MDLTYMPGELDYKNSKKNNNSDMKRDHDSVDDFEHLDPDNMSPVDTQDKGMSVLEKIETKLDSRSESPPKIDNSSEALIGDVFGSVPKPTQSVIGDVIPSKNNFQSDFDMHSTHIKNPIGLDKQEKSSLLDFGVDRDNSPFRPTATSDESTDEDDHNNSFISGEVLGNIVKTDLESDLLGLETKASVKDPKGLSQDDFDKIIDEKSINPELDSDNTKSMKEADALSQYDIKYEKKETIKKDDPETFEDDRPSDIFYKPEKHEAEADKPSKSEPEIKKAEISHSITAESDENVSEQNDPNEHEDDNGINSEGDVPMTPFIAICPSKPSTVASDVTSDTVKKPSVSDLDDIIGPEDVFKRIGLVEALVYWRDPKQSGVVFGSIMAILLSLCYMSLISVVAYSSLIALAGTVCFRIYKNILQAVQKTSEGHPFKEFLDFELSLPQDKVREIVDTGVVHVNAAIVELRRLFLVEDLIDSIKFGVCLWCLTYVGAIFNGMTLVILAFVALFTVPKIYENNKASIDTYIEMGRSKVAEITSKVKAAVPIGKKEPEKDKEQ